MSSISVVHPGPSPEEEDYGLAAIAEHNAGEYPPASYPEDVKHPLLYDSYQDTKDAGLGIYQEGYAPAPVSNPFQEYDQSYLHNPPTPLSHTASDHGIRTRSGRSTRTRTDSPFSSGKSTSRVSKSPMPRPKKPKSTKLDKSKTPKLTAPLSVLTKDMSIPMKDTDAHVNRSAEVRRQEMEKHEGYITRPMNCFMLYRSAYAERTKAWCAQNNHQVVSSVAGESWPMEPEEVQAQFKEYAAIERRNHALAHPDYKFSPSKSTSKKRKGGFSDDEDDEPSDLDDPDAEYGSGRRHKVPRRQVRDVEYLPSQPQGFTTNPYYGQPHYAPPQYAGRPLPSSYEVDPLTGRPYDPHAGQYLDNMQYVQPYDGRRIATPVSVHNQQQSLGGYGMPGQADGYIDSRTATPLQVQYAQQQQAHQQYAAQAQYAHQQYAQAQQYAQQYQPQMYAPVAVEPAYDPALMLQAEGSTLNDASHFADAFAEPQGVPPAEVDVFDQHTSPNATLAPAWPVGNDGLEY